ncbi:hypothetical protein BU23DRAFT_570551 [Bimuria novae-zelandiae CBS 107.79]|uniref:Saponin hydrolase n=1 Tax=Bimuria novae-zelandiae CBS 107.79 TaxID=1447943 RepID=A0A6A5V6K0_9PLEO|nr:hypothetical protein BU23DRAFT_570551 [Bimuria novae-zelandiae CBS 107.79]
MHLNTSSLAFLTVMAGYAAFPAQNAGLANVPPPPKPEPIEVIELPLPPVAPSDDVGSCTLEINSRGTGCVARELANTFQSGDFTPDGNHIIVTVKFVGAPASPDPASIYSGDQVILVKADGTTFQNGDPWKCLSCAVPEDQQQSRGPGVDYPHVFRSGDQVILVKADGTTFQNGDPWKCLSCAVPKDQQQSRDPGVDYPHVFRSGDKALWGHNILDCNGHQLADDDCTPEEARIYPIYWATIQDGIEVNGSPRELRLHPDDHHLGWSSLTAYGGQNTFFGRLEFNAHATSGNVLAPRYELVDVNLLYDSNRSQYLTAEDGELRYHDNAIVVGELRGFSGTGDEIVYIGETYEANNIDLFAVHVVTGTVRRLTHHPEYADPIAFSADNKWIIALDTRGTDRQMFMSGMRHVPPLVDLVTVTAAASTRNNGNRRFFQPILLDGYGDRRDYFGQHINTEGDGSNGAVNDPNWNARADPAFSLDGTKIVYWQAIVTGRECGGTNPLPCPEPTTQGQREYRVMLAKLTSRTPQPVPPVFEVPDQLPWATPFPPGAPFPGFSRGVRAGNYTLRGQVSGCAQVQLLSSSGNGSAIVSAFGTVGVNYTDYADVEGYVLNGWEKVTVKMGSSVWENLVDWYSDIEQTGLVTASKKTSDDGFRLRISALTNIFEANGTLTTTIDGAVYEQPANRM